MIKAILLDVDGVIVGTQKGINFPYPSQEVIDGLKAYQNRGLPISLITAKTSFSSTKETILRADLNNLHVTDAGAILIDPINYRVAAKHPIDKELALTLMRATDRQEIFWEVYTIDNWYAQKDVQTKLREGHENILALPIVQVDDILQLAEGLEEIIKLMVVFSPEQKEFLQKTFEPYKDRAQFQWGGNPNMAPNGMLNITAKGISKNSGARELASLLGVSMDEILGVGDTFADWEFIKDCGYAGAMGNSTQEFLDLVTSKDPAKYYVGKHVNENGVLDIIKHFEELGEIEFK